MGLLLLGDRAELGDGGVKRLGGLGAQRRLGVHG
jgi:hypothetical protein